MLEKINKVKGYFKYTLKDAKTGEVLEHFEEPNQIMNSVPEMYLEAISGLNTTSGAVTPPDVATTLKIEDFHLCTIAFGDEGFDYIKQEPKTIDPDKKTLDSMEQTNGKFLGNTVQATWRELETTDHDIPPVNGGQVAARGIFIQTEGEAHKSELVTSKFNEAGKNSGNVNHSETGIDIISTVENGVITLKIQMLEKTGNDGKNGINFSEAALFVRNKQDPGFSNHTTTLNATPSLGTIFSMKTFKPVHKTSACVLEVEWKLDFNF